MEKAALEARLARGDSIEQIARDVGRHASTVAYWVRKHGLESKHARRHAARGGIDERLLREIVACELPVRDMAEVLGCSPTTVRYWLRRHGLASAPSRRHAAATAAATAGVRELELRCRRHGVTRHVLRRDGYRCARCGAERVAAWRRKVKRILVEEAGGACTLCGYDRYVGALHFHHVDPATKRFSVSREGVTRSLAEARAEAAKCVLLCANCHAEVEGGAQDIHVGSEPCTGYPA